MTGEKASSTSRLFTILPGISAQHREAKTLPSVAGDLWLTSAPGRKQPDSEAHKQNQAEVRKVHGDKEHWDFWIQCSLKVALYSSVSSICKPWHQPQLRECEWPS